MTDIKSVVFLTYSCSLPFILVKVKAALTAVTYMQRAIISWIEIRDEARDMLNYLFKNSPS
jgi:hypothetical protein